MIAAAPFWLAVGLLGGASLPDSRFADYQWKVDPRAAWGVETFAGRGRFAAGLRVARSRTTQTIGIPDPSSAATVNATSAELVARGTFVSLAGFELAATASGGRLHLGWDPDHVEGTVAGTPVSADLAPVDTWIGGGGVALTRRLPGPWRAGLSLDRRFFSMETAHRIGGAIVTGTQTFGDWNARVELSWLALGMKGTS